MNYSIINYSQGNILRDVMNEAHGDEGVLEHYGGTTLHTNPHANPHKTNPNAARTEQVPPSSTIGLGEQAATAYAQPPSN